MAQDIHLFPFWKSESPCFCVLPLDLEQASNFSVFLVLSGITYNVIVPLRKKTGNSSIVDVVVNYSSR